MRFWSAKPPGSYRAAGGRLQGCPLQGVRRRRWRCGCRARMALSDRAAGVLRAASRPASRLVHRPVFCGIRLMVSSAIRHPHKVPGFQRLTAEPFFSLPASVKFASGSTGCSDFCRSASVRLVLRVAWLLSSVTSGRLRRRD